MLYDPALDGIEDPSSDIGREYGMANLHPQRWFQPFRASLAVHPYVADRVG
ncbi:MAG: hypothetical protein M3O70_22565 [Actinomycetota bacterium]|nr:hypothetical protein [Actinomycetota bacterium]